jgi:ABC-type transporter Mla MlaB component
MTDELLLQIILLIITDAEKRGDNVLIQKITEQLTKLCEKYGIDSN